jgi:hypothetical protein
VTEAIIGLVGVIVGAVVTAGLDWLRQSRREAAEAIVARRLVGLELTLALNMLRIAHADGRWWPDAIRLRTDAWEAHKSILAASMPEQEWSMLATAFVGIDYMSQVRVGTASRDLSDHATELGELLPRLSAIAAELRLTPVARDPATVTDDAGEPRRGEASRSKAGGPSES